VGAGRHEALAAAALTRPGLSVGGGSIARVTTWAEVEQQVPELAARVRERFAATKHKTMATLRADGSPRISGTETEFADGQLTWGSMDGAVKLADLRRDPRVALHSATVDPLEGQEESWVGEAKVAGRAVAIPSPGTGPDGAYFALDVTEVVFVSIAPGGKELAVESWHPSRGYQRRLRS
jgi:hypothetical protein